MIGDAIMYRIACQWSVFPLQLGGKQPLFKWDRYRSQRARLQEIQGWNPQWNLALATGAISGVVVVDCESADDAGWFLSQRSHTPFRVQTPRGYHLYFRHPGGHIGNAAKVPDEHGHPRYDIRGDGGYVLLPPSQVSDAVAGVSVSGRYQLDRCTLTDLKSIPVFRNEWHRQEGAGVRGQRSGEFSSFHSQPSSLNRVTDGIKYISHIHATSGSGGHNETFRAVCRLRDSGMTASEAYAAICDWNQTNANPPWSDGELQHKIRSVYGKA